MTIIKKFSEKLMGQTICLCKNEESSAAEMFQVIEQNRQQLSEFLPWPDKIKTVQDQLNYIKMTNESWNQKALFDYGIYQLSNQKFIGNMGVHSIDWRNSRCELGYWIIKGLEGKGLVSEGVRILEDECFKMGFHRIEIRCSSLNEKSAFVALRNNFVLEGYLKDEVIENGQFRDTLIFAKRASHRQKSKDSQDN
jgi:ribosomal-protein-serine acetyltransferase